MVAKASRRWVVVDRRECGYISAEAELREERVYPADTLPDVFGYRVVSRECSRSVECNLAGVPCKWSFLNPYNDPFTRG